MMRTEDDDIFIDRLRAHIEELGGALAFTLSWAESEKVIPRKAVKHIKDVILDNEVILCAIRGRMVAESGKQNADHPIGS